MAPAVHFPLLFSWYTLHYMTDNKILLVEDSEPLRKVLAEKLRDEKFDVIEAGGGEEGLKLANDQKPDINAQAVSRCIGTGL